MIQGQVLPSRNPRTASIAPFEPLTAPPHFPEPHKYVSMCKETENDPVVFVPWPLDSHVFGSDSSLSGRSGVVELPIVTLPLSFLFRLAGRSIAGVAANRA